MGVEGIFFKVKAAVPLPIDNSRVDTVNGKAAWDPPWDAGEEIVFEAGKEGLLKTSRYIPGEGSAECYQGTRGGKTIYIPVPDSDHDDRLAGVPIYKDGSKTYENGKERRIVVATNEKLTSGQRDALEAFNLKAINKFNPQPADANERSFLLGLLNDGAAFLAGTTIADHLDKVNLTGEKE